MKRFHRFVVLRVCGAKLPMGSPERYLQRAAYNFSVHFNCLFLEQFRAIFQEMDNSLLF
jgi:hypothetical protein